MSGTGDEIEWYLAREGKQFGPLTDGELKKVIELGHLKPDDLLWRAGQEDWQRAATIFPEDDRRSGDDTGGGKTGIDKTGIKKSDSKTGNKKTGTKKADSKKTDRKSKKAGSSSQTESDGLAATADSSKADSLDKSGDDNDRLTVDKAAGAADAAAGDKSASNKAADEATAAAAKNAADDKTSDIAAKHADQRDGDRREATADRDTADRGEEDSGSAGKPVRSAAENKTGTKNDPSDRAGGDAASGKTEAAGKDGKDGKTVPETVASGERAARQNDGAPPRAARQASAAGSPPGSDKITVDAIATDITAAETKSAAKPAAASAKLSDKSPSRQSPDQQPAPGTSGRAQRQPKQDRPAAAARRHGNSAATAMAPPQPRTKDQPHGPGNPPPAHSSSPQSGRASNPQSERANGRGSGQARTSQSKAYAHGRQNGTAVPQQGAALPPLAMIQQTNHGAMPQPAGHRRPPGAQPRPGQPAHYQWHQGQPPPVQPLPGQPLPRQPRPGPAMPQSANPLAWQNSGLPVPGSQGSRLPGNMPGYQPMTAAAAAATATPAAIVAGPARRSLMRRVVMPLTLLGIIGTGGWLVYSDGNGLGPTAKQYYDLARSQSIRSYGRIAMIAKAWTGAASSPQDNPPNANPSHTMAPGEQRDKSIETASLAKPPASQSTATAAASSNGRQAVAAANPLQGSPLWRFIEREYPEWYAERAKEALSIKDNIKDDHAIRRLMEQKLLALRQEHAAEALNSSPERLRAVAANFLKTLQVLSSHSIEACYGFISNGEFHPKVLELMKDPAYSDPLDAQTMAILAAAVEGKRNPITHEPPKPADYRALGTELMSRGWTMADLRLFTDPVALSAAKPAKVCRMVQTWFSAQLALPDSDAQLRLLVQSLRPVIAG